MKKILLATAAIGLLFTACKKDDDLPTTTNTWKAGANTRTATGVSVQNNSLVATDNANSITVTFGGTLPTTDGTFRIVGGTPDPGEVSVMVNEGTSVYYSTGNDNKDAKVKVASNKVSVEIPDVWAKNLLGTDSLFVSADLKQP